MRSPQLGRAPRGPSLSATHGDSIYETLRNQIVHGVLPPHARVVESAIATKLGVSRTPVREALARLASEGFLTTSRGSRRIELVVSALTADDLEELWTLVGAIESAAAGRVDRIAPADRRRLVAVLQQINQELGQLVRSRTIDAERYGALQGKFHETLVQSCGGARIRAAHAAIRPHVARYEAARARLPKDASQRSIEEHDEIIAAIARGVPSAARAAVLRHWLRAAERSAAVIAAGGAASPEYSFGG